MQILDAPVVPLVALPEALTIDRVGLERFDEIRALNETVFGESRVIYRLDRDDLTILLARWQGRLVGFKVGYGESRGTFYSAKGGVLPEALDAFIAACPVTVVGLMTMPPYVERAEDSRRHFAALAQLAADRGLPQLSMGTTQDFAVAAQEGATIVRVGTRLFG